MFLYSYHYILSIQKSIQSHTLLHRSSNIHHRRNHHNHYIH